MNPNWTKADAWFRRDVDEHSYLTVSRTGDTWGWRWHARTNGTLLGKSDLKGHPSHLGAMIEADQTSFEMYEAAS